MTLMAEPLCLFLYRTVELHRFWIIRTVAVVISETGVLFPFIFNSGVGNAYIIYVFI